MNALMAAAAEHGKSLADSFQLLCPKCRYDLRGHRQRDPIVCPECGWTAKHSDLFVTVREYKQALATLAALPGLCFLSELMIVLGCLGVYVMWFKQAGTEVLVTYLVIAALGIVGGLYFVGRFRKSCKRRPGWRACLAWGQFRFFVVIAVMVCGWLLFGRLADALFRGVVAMEVYTIGAFVVWFAIFTLIVRAAGGTESLMGEHARRFQRDAAVEMAWRLRKFSQTVP